MKSTRFKGLFLASLLTLSANFAHSHSNVLTTNSGSAVDKMGVLSGKGGADTGGGNQLGSEPISKEQIADYLKKAKFPAKFIIRRLELILTEFQGGKAIRQENQFKDLATKLFAGPKTLLTALEDAQFEPLDKGPCFDSQGVPADGSAISATKLCFSLERLSSKLNSDSVQAEILALVIHEVSHTLGTTELEADFLQRTVKDTLINKPFSTIETKLRSYGMYLDDLIESTDSLIKNLEIYQVQETCAAIAFLLTSIGRVSDMNLNGASNTDKSGITFSGVEEIILLNGVMLKTVNTLTYCVTSNPEYKKMINAFQGKKEMSLREFESIIYDRTLASPLGLVYMPSPDWIIRRQINGNLAPLTMELNDVSHALKEVKNKL